MNNSLQDFITYIKRRLGEPVINVEIADEQIVQCINDAVQLFAERHYAGSKKVFYKQFITKDDVANNRIVVPSNIIAITDIYHKNNNVWIFDNAKFNIMDEIRRQRKGYTGNLTYFYISQSYLSLINNMLNPVHLYEFNPTTHELIPFFKITDEGSPNILINNDFNSWTPTNCTIATGALDKLSGTTGFDIQANAIGICSIKYIHDTKRYIRYRYTFSFDSLSPIPFDVIIQDSLGNTIKSQQIQSSQVWSNNSIWFDYLDTHADDIVITISFQATTGNEKISLSNPKLYANNFIVYEAFETVSPQKSIDVYNDRWVKDYATALAKLQWGSNLKKYSGVQMPGGVELNGQQIYDEAKEEIEQLREQLYTEFDEPPPFIIG